MNSEALHTLRTLDRCGQTDAHYRPPGDALPGSPWDRDLLRVDKASADMSATSMTGLKADAGINSVQQVRPQD